MPAISERHVLVEVEGGRCRGRLDGDSVVLEDGSRVEEPVFLAPVAPSKIVAVHLSYRSRIEEYAARIPTAPSYFMKPPSALNGHRGVVRRPVGGRFLNYEGELAVVVGERMKDHEIYFAGPPMMADAVMKMLLTAGVPSTQIHFDQFF